MFLGFSIPALEYIPLSGFEQGWWGVGFVLPELVEANAFQLTLLLGYRFQCASAQKPFNDDLETRSSTQHVHYFHRCPRPPPQPEATETTTANATSSCCCLWSAGGDDGGSGWLEDGCWRVVSDTLYLVPCASCACFSHDHRWYLVKVGHSTRPSFAN